MFRPDCPSSGVKVVVVKDSAAHCNAVFFPPVLVVIKLMVTDITKITRGNYNRKKENRITVSSRILNHNNLYT
jgi:hypothetical protein